jgi:phosphinothricin acetyltransferase
MGAVHVRDATDDDLVAVADIYTYESLHSYSTFETGERPVAAWRHKLEAPYPLLVAEEGGTVIGFAHASAFRDRPAYHRTVETSVYLHRAARGRRVGSELYGALLPRLAAAGFHTALALIALPNEASVRLHERAGFELDGLLREVGDKHDRLIDVGVYQLMLRPSYSDVPKSAGP